MRRHPLVVFNGAVFFVGNDGLGEQIFLSDGTPDVTLMVFAGQMVEPSQLVVTPQWIYFVGKFNQSASNYTLWRTNGFTGGTMEIPNSEGSGGGQYAELVALGSEVYFTHDNGDGCLYKSSGSGVTQVKCIKQTVLAYLENLTAVGDKLYFAGSTSYSSDYEPYISDGTAAGTVQIREISTSGGSDPKWFTAFKNSVYFVAGRKLWVTQGTSATTLQVNDITVSYAQNDRSGFLATPDFLYFPGDDGATGTDQELWKTDGTTAGTTQVKELASFGAGNPQEWALANGKVYFQANNGEGEELWVTNGTEAGTTKLTNLNPDINGGSRPRKLVQIGQKLYFIANSPATGAEWFSLDLPVSVLDLARLELDLTVQPNPTTNYLHIRIAQADAQASYALAVYSSDGVRVHQSLVTGIEHGIAVEAWPQGVYRIVIRDAAGRLGSMSFVKAE
jgi:ELWxxDGT repeat protein